MACLASQLAVEAETRTIRPTTLSCVSSQSSSTLTSDGSQGSSRMAKALQLLLCEQESITSRTSIMKSTHRTASSDDILDSNKHSLAHQATKRWQTASSLDTLTSGSYPYRDCLSLKKDKTFCAAMQLWRSIVVNIEPRLRGRYQSRLSLRRVLCLHPHFTGCQVLECIMEYLTTAVGRHMVVDRGHGHIVCVKLLQSGVMENIKDSTCDVFSEDSSYRFTGRHVRKVEKRVTIIDPKHTAHKQLTSKFGSFLKQMQKQRIHNLDAHDKERQNQRVQLLPSPTTQHLKGLHTHTKTHKLPIQRHQVGAVYSQPQEVLCRSMSFTNVLSQTNDSDTKWILYGYV